MKRFFPFLGMAVMAIGLGASCASWSAREFLGDSAQEVPYQAMDPIWFGREAMAKKNYDFAFEQFLAYSLNHPGEGIGPLFCGHARYRQGRYDEAMHYYRKASRLSPEDERVCAGIARCALALLRKEVKGASTAQEGKGIEETFDRFRKSLAQKAYESVAKQGAIQDLTLGMGMAVSDEKGVREAISSYIGTMSTPAMVTYAQALETKEIFASPHVALVELGLPGEKASEGVYLKKMDGTWRVALFPCSIAEGRKSAAIAKEEESWEEREWDKVIYDSDKRSSKKGDAGLRRPAVEKARERARRYLAKRWDQVLQWGKETRYQDRESENLERATAKLSEAKEKFPALFHDDPAQREKALNEQIENGIEALRGDARLDREIKEIVDRAGREEKIGQEKENEAKAAHEKKRSAVQKYSSGGRYCVLKSGIIQDTRTGLEWIFGPDRDMTWDEAKAWVEKISPFTHEYYDGGEWRMPTRAELKSLYEEGKGEYNIDPVFRISPVWELNKYLFVWAGEKYDPTADPTCAWGFGFYDGMEYWETRIRSLYFRAFAVRRGKSG